MWDRRCMPVAHRPGCTLRPCPMCTRMSTCSMVMSRPQRLSHSGGHMCMRVPARCVLQCLVPTCTCRRYVAHVPTRCIVVVIATGWDAANCTPSTPPVGGRPLWAPPTFERRLVHTTRMCACGVVSRSMHVRRLDSDRTSHVCPTTVHSACWVYRPVSLWVTIA